MRNLKRRGRQAITIYYINIYKDIRIDQRATGGGQINRHVGTNANQGGQIASKSSKNANQDGRIVSKRGKK
jgi:hypothetical protein